MKSNASCLVKKLKCMPTRALPKLQKASRKSNPPTMDKPFRSLHVSLAKKFSRVQLYWVARLVLTYREGLLTAKEPDDTFVLALGLSFAFEAVAVELAVRLADILLAAAAKLLDTSADDSARKAIDNDIIQ